MASGTGGVGSSRDVYFTSPVSTYFSFTSGQVVW